MGERRRQEEAAELRAATPAERERFYATLRRVDTLGRRVRGTPDPAGGSQGGAAQGPVVTQDWNRSMGTTSVHTTVEFPDYTSKAANLIPAAVNPVTRETIYTLRTTGRDGELGIATSDAEQAQEFLHMLKTIQEKNEYVIRHTAAAALAEKKAQSVASAPRKELTQRVGDPEKNVIIQVLDGAFTHGYLTQDEFGERSGKALTATSQAQLNALIADLQNIQQVERTYSEYDWQLVHQENVKLALRNRVLYSRSMYLTVFSGMLSVVLFVLMVAGNIH